MKYRHTMLYPEREGSRYRQPSTPEVNDHMSEVSAEGWRLVSANALTLIIFEERLFVHSFYWEKDE